LPAAGSGWQRLWRHSYRLGLRWLAREARRGWPGRRVGLQRLLVPLDPWRYYELGRVAEEPFDGDCLDVSSPKLLPSLLSSEGRGRWVAVDLFSDEIERWRHVDPALDLRVADATELPVEDASFDNAICISVLEHIPGDGDARAMAELWRVLRPGGVLHVTTDVAAAPRDIYRDEKIYGEASKEGEDGGSRVFFARHYGPGEIDSRLLGQPWEVLTREYARQRDESVERRFYTRAPWSYAYGGALRFKCADNFEVSESPDVVAGADHGVVYMRLRRPA
jgi:SAM-dependent methyltransferase